MRPAYSPYLRRHLVSKLWYLRIWSRGWHEYCSTGLKTCKIFVSLATFEVRGHFEFQCRVRTVRILLQEAKSTRFTKTHKYPGCTHTAASTPRSRRLHAMVGALWKHLYRPSKIAPAGLAHGPQPRQTGRRERVTSSTRLPRPKPSAVSVGCAATRT